MNPKNPGLIHSFSEQLYRHIRLRVLLGLMLTGLIIGAVASAFLYQSRANELESEALFQWQLTRLALESELTRLRNLTRQITSRSRIREELQRYLRGEVTLDALRSFSKPKLSDALNLSDDMVAINRVGLSGALLVSVGNEIPRNLWPRDWQLADVAVGLPGRLERREVLVVSAPIFDRQGLTVGIDLVAFDVGRLSEVLEGSDRSGVVVGQTALLARGTAPEPIWILTSAAQDRADAFTFSAEEMNRALSDTADKPRWTDLQPGQGASAWVGAYRRLDGVDWVLAVFSERDAFYRLARNKALIAGISILLLMAVGGALTYLLVRPVAGRISVETDSFKRLLQERENLLEEVRASEARLQAILDNTTALLYLKDPQGRYRLTNRSFQSLVALPADLINGKTEDALFPAEFAALSQKHDREVADHLQPLEVDERLEHLGEIHHYLAVKFPILDARGELVGVCGILTDISERKKAEQELVRSEERFELAMKAANDGLWDWDLTTDEVYYSPRWKSMLGYEDHELDNVLATWQSLTGDVGREATLDLVSACLRGDSEGFSIAFRMRHKLGYWVDILSRGLLVRDAQGKPVRMVGTHQDISARIRDEQALRESRQRLHEEKEFVDAVLQAAGNIIVVLNRKGYFERINKATEELTGYRFEELRGKPFYETVIPPELRAEVKAVFSDLMDEKIVRKHQNEWQMKDGSRRMIDWHNTVLTDADGNISHVVSQGYDITDMRLTAQELQEHRDKLEVMVRQRTEELQASMAYNRTLFQTSPIGLVLCDMDGRFVDVNPAFLKIIGYDDAEVKSLSYWDVTPREYEAQEAQQLQSLRDTGFYGPYEKEYRHKDGHRVPVKLSGLLIEQEGQTFIWSAVEDTSELKAQRSQLETVIENLPAVFFIKDDQHRHLLVNRRFEQAVGLDGKQILGRTDTDLFPPAVAQHLSETDSNVLNGKQAVSYEESFTHPDGNMHDYLTTKVPLFNEHTQRYNLLGIAVDISELKQLQHELSAARDRAEKLAQAKSVFLANMSHEIRTPMNAVLGFARMGLRDSEDAGLTEKFRHILNSGEHLLAILNDILDLSKIDAGKMAVIAEPMDLMDLVDGIAKLFAEECECKGLDLHVETQSGLPDRLSGDALRLRQVLVNLMSNAIKFTDRGSVSLRVTRRGEEICFAVQDSGIGIESSRLEGLFQPFDQGDSSTTRRFGGTGLGLAICQNLAGLMGGYIEAASEQGKGSTFTLCLPLREVQEMRGAPAKEEQQPTARRRLQGLRILAVEDVDLNRIILHDMLHAEGAELVFAENGREAVAKVEELGEGALDVILMDIQMPLMDGYEATRRIHQLAPMLPVIGLTAHALQEERGRCLAAGMVEHVTKPFDLDQIVTAINSWVPK